ncbi:MAG: hypothetical protein ACREJQ_01640, partial [bacterium]
TLPHGQAIPLTVEGFKNNALVGALCTNAGGSLTALKHAEDRVVVISTCGPITILVIYDSDADSGTTNYESVHEVRRPACPALAIGQSCDFAETHSTLYSDFATMLHLQRVATNEYMVTAKLTAESSVPPLAGGASYATTTGLASMTIVIPLVVPGTNRVTLMCNAKGDRTFIPQTNSYVGSNFYLQLLVPQSFPPECDKSGPLDPPPMWTINGTHSVVQTTTNQSVQTSMSVSAEAEQYRMPGQAGYYLYELKGATAQDVEIIQLHITVGAP